MDIRPVYYMVCLTHDANLSQPDADLSHRQIGYGTFSIATSTILILLVPRKPVPTDRLE